MANRTLVGEILALLRTRSIGAASLLTAGDITAVAGGSRSTVNRALTRLLAGGFIERTGRGPATQYRALAASGSADPASAVGVRESRGLRDYLARPLALRAPAAYERDFVEGYVPNESSLLPADLAASLRRDGRAPGQQPAGTVARKLLEQLLIDLSWHSSRLEGNRTSLLDTRTLFERGRSGAHDPEAIMLLNHNDAIQFLIDAVRR